MQQKLVQFFLQQEAGHRKGTAKTKPKIENYVYYIFTKNICSACNPMQVVVFSKDALIL